MVDRRHNKTTSQFVSETKKVIPATPTDDFSRKMLENQSVRCDSEIPLTRSLDTINHVRKSESLSGKSSNEEPTAVEKVKQSDQVDDIRHDKTTYQNEPRTNSALVKMDTKTCDEVDGKVTSSVGQRQIEIGNETKILRVKKDNPKTKIRKRAKKSRHGQMCDKPIRQKKKEKTLPVRPIDNISTNKRFRKIFLKRKSKKSSRKRTPNADFRRTFTHETQKKSKRKNWIKNQTKARELKQGDFRSRDIYRKLKKKKKTAHTFESVFVIARPNCFEKNDCFKLLRRIELTKRRYFKMSYHILEKCGKLKTRKEEENTKCDTKYYLYDRTLNGDEVKFEQRLLPFKYTSTSDDFQTNVKTRGYWLSEIQMKERISVFAVTFDDDDDDNENLLPTPNLPGLSTIPSNDNVSVSELNVQVRTQNRDSNSGAERQHNNGTIYTRQFQTQSTSPASETVASVEELPKHVNLNGQMIVTVIPAPNEGAPSIKETGIIAESSGYNGSTYNPVAQCYTGVHCAQQTVFQNESTGLGRGCEQHGNDHDDSSDTEDEE